MTHLLVPKTKKLPGRRERLRLRSLREVRPDLMPAPVRRRRWWPKLLLAGLSFLLAVGVALTGYELYLRSAGEARFPALGMLYDFYVNDSVPGQVRMKPGYHGTQVVEGRELHVAINSQGMRGPEIPPPAPDQLRVLFLGDSLPFGHGVESAESFPMQVQSILSQQLGQKVIVGNAGVPGASHADEVRQLERHIDAFQPDLVVSCLYTGNDFDGDFFGPKVAIDGYWFGTEAARFIESSWRAKLCLHLRTALVFEQFLDAHFPSLSMDKSAMQPTPEEAARHAAFGDTPLDEGLFMDRIERTPGIDLVLSHLRQNLQAIRERAGDVPVMVAVLPSWAETWPGVYPAALKHFGLGSSPEAFERGKGPHRVASLCRQLDLPCADLTPAMASHPAPVSLYLPTDLHYSVAGNRFVAERLASVIRTALHPEVAVAGWR